MSVVLAAIALIGAPVVLAETQHGVLAGYTVTSWTLADGVPIGPINAIAQDADGYLWLGTTRGVVRFDGARFTPWDGINSTRLPDAEVLALSWSRNRTLWVGFARIAGGVSVAALRDGKIVTVSEGVAPRDSTTAVIEDRAGDVWAVSNGALHRLHRGRWDVMRSHPLGGVVVLGVREDARGTLWVGTRDGLFRRRDADRFELVDPGLVRDASESAGGTLWITDPAHGARRHGALPGSINADGRGMRLLHDARENLWVATTGQGVWRVRDTATTTTPLVERLTTQTGLSSDVVQSILEDREGNIWVGTMLGLHSLTPQQLTALASDALVQTILPDPDGSVWVGTTTGVLQFHNDGGTWRGRRVSDHGDIQSLFRDGRGRAWARTGPGLRAFLRGRLVEGPPATQVAPPCSNGAMMSPAGAVTGAADRRRVTAVNAAPEPAVAIRPRCVTRDALWAAGTGDTLTVRRGEHLLASIRLPSPPAIVSQRAIDTIFEDAQGTMWAGSTAGLWRIREGQAEHFGEHEGLPAQRVMAMTQSADGFLWLAVDRGRLHPGRRAALIRLHPSDVDRHASAKTPLTGYTIFDAVNGLAGVALGTATAARSTDGSLWFAIGGSLTVVDPREVAHAEPPREILAQIAAATVDDRPVAPASTSALAAGTRQVQIDYTALRLTAPGQIRFRYRLDGFDRDWVDAGARRQAYYTNLAPGNYVFRVQANGDGVAWTVPEARWAFVVQPAFRQTGWFYALCGTALLLTAWGVAQTRVWILNRQFAATVAERARLSREIHDTMLQSLAGIALQVQAIARGSLPQASEQRSQLLALRREVEEHIREARQAVQNLRSPMLEAYGLAGALTEICRRTVARPTRFDVSADQITSTEATEGELLRIGQEAITNAARHAGATHIRVDLRQEPEVIRVRVTDDGRGFDVAAVMSAGSGRYGLLGMQERAARLGGRLTITSSASGTVVEAKVPRVRNDP
jgi:signal transduction histidine kinase/ligand-binding sensor domain-containing protein